MLLKGIVTGLLRASLVGAAQLYGVQQVVDDGNRRLLERAFALRAFGPFNPFLVKGFIGLVGPR